MNKSFTLIEILVVIVVIGILSAFILVGTSSITNSANIAKSKAFSDSIRNSLLNSLVSEYKFEGPTSVDSLATTSDVTDSWKTNNSNALNGNPYIKGDCLSNKCIAFDGIGDTFSIPDSISLDEIFGTENFTLEAWIMPVYRNDYQGVINKRTNDYYSASPGGIFINNVGDSAVFLIGTGNPSETWVGITTSISGLHGKWIHIVGTAGGGYMKLYLNSIQKGNTVPITVNPPTNNEPMTIGGFYANVRSFSGQIDEVRIYNNPISLSKIKENYYLGLSKLLKNKNIALNEFNQRLTELKSNLATHE